MRNVIKVLFVTLVVFTGCQNGEKSQKELSTAQEEIVQITLQSDAFRHLDFIPRTYTGEGQNVSPPLSWNGAPAGTREFVLICDDPDAPRPEPWVHWIVYGIPAGTTQLVEGNGGDFSEGTNSWGKTGYGGPMPPKGHGQHHYHFKIYALNTQLELEPGAAKEQVLQAMEGHIVAQGELIGTYQR